VSLNTLTIVDMIVLEHKFKSVFCDHLKVTKFDRLTIFDKDYYCSTS